MAVAISESAPTVGEHAAHGSVVGTTMAAPKKCRQVECLTIAPPMQVEKDQKDLIIGR